MNGRQEQSDPLDRYPQQVQIGVQQTVVYVRQSGFYAVQYPQVESLDRSSAVLLFEESQIAVFQGQPTPSRQLTDAAAVIAVYSPQPGGSLAVPTGEVFVRFQEGTDVTAYQTTLQQVGYDVTQVLSYAPHAAWLRARSGEIADALCWLSRLKAIDPVEAVEPQMLMQRSPR